MNDLMSSVSPQIQRAISEANNEQVLPQIEATPRSGQGQMPRKGWKDRLRDRNIDLKKPLIAISGVALGMSPPETKLEMRTRRKLTTVGKC